MAIHPFYTVKVDEPALKKAQEETAYRTCMGITREAHDAVIEEAIKTYLAAIEIEEKRRREGG